MFRLYVKLAVLVTAAAVLPMLLIRARPYDDSHLRALFLPPEGCPSPCLLGIRPGETSIPRAMRILNAHEWVSDALYHFGGLTADPRFISWRWKDGEMPLVDSTLKRGHMRLNANNTIRDFTFPTYVTLGDIWLWLGPPQKQLTVGYKGVELRMSYSAVYETNELVFGFARACPLKSLWHTQVGLVALDDREAFVEYTPQDFPMQVYETCRVLRQQ